MFRLLYLLSWCCAAAGFFGIAEGRYADARIWMLLFLVSQMLALIHLFERSPADRVDQVLTPCSQMEAHARRSSSSAARGPDLA